MTFALEPPPGPHDPAGHAFWPTPRWVVELLLDKHPPLTEWVIEPSAGEGGIVRPLLERGKRVCAVEVRPECRHRLQPAELLFCPGNWLTTAHQLRLGAPASIIGNPPWDPADEMLSHVRVCLSLEQVPYVALLLPTSFLHSQARRAFWRAHPASAIYPIAKRPRFADGGGGKQDCSWFVWDRTWPEHQQRIEVLG